MKAFFRGLLAFIVIVVLAGAAGTFIPRPLFAPEKPAAAETRRILVLSNPIHTDIAIPLTDDVREAYAFLETSGVPISDPLAQWLVIGWGGRSFYLETPTWADLKPMPVLRALTVDRSVLRVDVAGGINEGHLAITAFNVDLQQFQRLSSFIQESFVRNAGEVKAIPNAGYGDYDRFFEAHGAFNALFGCNTWTAGALRAAGLRTGFWNPLPQSLVISLKLFN